MSEGFYVLDGDDFIPTEWARGPWDPSAQHAGPPAALLARAAEQVPADREWSVSRLAMDILRPIPLAPLHVTASVRKSGRRTQLIDARLSSDGVEVARASVWRIRGAATENISDPLPHPLPGEVAVTPMVHPGWDPSYFTALEWRYVSGSLFESGPSAVWMKMRQPLIAGEEPSPLTRVLVAADSGNGVSSVLPLASHLFINVELSVHWIRPSQGEWICLDATTATGPGGLGVARSTIWDESGCVAFGSQSLLVSER
jgi:Acyl-CoA thioesterase C-terminal domain/Acyl-CoA thioesterase N-terminal domain